MAGLMREATRKDFPVLEQYLKTKLPYSMSVLCMVEVTDKFQFSRRIYVSQPDPTEFIFVTRIRSKPEACFGVFWDIEKLQEEDVIKYLKSVPNWNWNQTTFAFRVESSLSAKIENILINGYLTDIPHKKGYQGDCYTFEIVPGKLSELRLPEGYKMAALKPCHVPLILEKWRHGEGENIKDYEEVINKLPSAAVYMEDDIELENPVAWTILYNFGKIGMTYTLPPFRRLGLGSAVEISLCKKLLEAKMPVTADVETFNDASIAMHDKMGLKIIKTVSYTQYCLAE